MVKIKTAMMGATLALAGCGNVAAPGNAVGNDARPIPMDTLPRSTGPAEVEFGPEETISGTYVTRFEHSEFNGCWLDMDAAYPDFRRRFPGRDEHSGRFGTFELQIVGRRSINRADRPAAYGHMGGSPCEIKAVRIISAAEVGHDRSAPDATPGKDAGLGAGHDQARLDEIRRSLPPAKP